MRQRAAEIIFTHKFLILLPLFIVLPLTIGAELRPQPKLWKSSARVWVDQPRSLLGNDELMVSPATKQAQLINDFLHTRSFATAVLQQTQLAPRLRSPQTRERALQLFSRSVIATPDSDSFVTVDVTMPDPDLTFKTAQAIVSQYQTTLEERNQREASAALSLYGDELKQAADAVSNSRTQLATYLAQHPQLLQRSPDVLFARQDQDINLALLSEQAKADQDTYNSFRQRYLNIQQGAEADRQGQPLAFTVIDAPEPPLAPLTRRLLLRLELPLIGLVLGLMLSSGVAALLVLTERKILGPYDFPDSLGILVLGEIPELKLNGSGGRRGSDDAVRARLAASARTVAPWRREVVAGGRGGASTAESR